MKFARDCSVRTVLPAASLNDTAPVAKVTSAVALPAFSTTLPPTCSTVKPLVLGAAITCRLGGTLIVSVGEAVTRMARSLITCRRTFLAGPLAGVMTTPSAVFSKPPSRARAEVEARRASPKAERARIRMAVPVSRWRA